MRYSKSGGGKPPPKDGLYYELGENPKLVRTAVFFRSGFRLPLSPLLLFIAVL